MSCVGGESLAGESVPELGSLGEGASGDASAIGDIEGHAVDCVLVALERVYQRASAGVPNFAGAVVAARDEFIAVLVEAAVRQRQHVSFKFLDQDEFLLPLLLDLLDELLVFLRVLLIIARI